MSYTHPALALQSLGPAAPSLSSSPVTSTQSPWTPRAEALTGAPLQPQTRWAESSQSRAPVQPCPPTLAPAFPLHKCRRPRHSSEAEKATTGAGTGRLPPACPGKGPAGPEKGQLPTRAGQVPAVPGLARTEQTAAAAPGPDCADGGPSSRSRVRRVPQAEPSSHPTARRFRAFISEKVKACRYSNKIYKKIKFFYSIECCPGLQGLRLEAAVVSEQRGKGPSSPLSISRASHRPPQSCSHTAWRGLPRHHSHGDPCLCPLVPYPPAGMQLGGSSSPTASPTPPLLICVCLPTAWKGQEGSPNFGKCRTITINPLEVRTSALHNTHVIVLHCPTASTSSHPPAPFNSFPFPP